MPLTFNYTLVDSSGYLQVYSLSPTYSFVTGEYQYASATIKLQKRDFLKEPAFPEENRDGSNTSAGIAWFRLISQQKGFVTLKFELDKEKTTGVNWSFFGSKVGAGALYPVNEHLKLALGIELWQQGYDNVHTFYGTKRTDTSYSASTQLLYALTPDVDAQLQYVLINNGSTVTVYEYHKNIVSIGVYARF
jgi:hypothetical protein